ncbi:MAG: hypothetical protein JWL59_2601 [Chthoniobacteraceae bacterium]|nr:hypothetical protein [Chthoniobacteraceae bacterium]
MIRRTLIIFLCAPVAAAAALFLFLPRYAATTATAELSENMSRLKSVATALKIYSIDMDKPPGSLRELMPNYISNEQFTASLYCDVVSKRPYDWLYFGNLKLLPSDTTIIAASPSTQIGARQMMHHRIIARANTAVEIITEEDFIAELKVQNIGQFK